jgi:3'-phosphoadenosine 5'-phosphosulfate sulfotransferase
MLKILGELVVLLWPHIKNFLVMLKDHEARQAALSLKKAKTEEEKYEAAKKIAARLYSRSIGQ